MRPASVPSIFRVKKYLYPVQSNPTSIWRIPPASGMLVLSVLLLLRFLQLEADPSFLKSIHDIDDEGWCAAPAIQFLRQGTWLLSGQSGGFLLAPIYSLLLAAWLSIGGISVFSIKLFHLFFLVLSVLGIRQWVGADKAIWPWSAALFLSNLFWFDFSRIGFPENLQFCGLIWMFVLFRQFLHNPCWWRTIGLGLLIAATLLVKLSLLGFLPALLIGLWFLSKPVQIPIKELLVALGTVFFLLALYYFFLFLPYYDSFLLQKEWMALSFPGLSDILQYQRVLFWLFHTIQVPFFQHISNVLWLLAVVLYAKEKGFVSGLSLTMFLAMVVLNLLGDGSERRLVFLFIPLILAFSEEKAALSKPLPFWLKWTLMIFMVGNCYFFVLEQLPDFAILCEPIFSAPSAYPMVWLVLSIATIGWFWIRRELTALLPILHRIFMAVCVLFFFAWVLSAFFGLRRHLDSLNPLTHSYFYLPCVLGLTILILFGLFSHKRLFPWFIGLSLAINCGLQIHYHLQATHQRQNLGKKLDVLLRTSRLAGPNLSFGMHEMAHFQPLYHSDVTKGYESIFSAALMKADFYMDVYPAYEKQYDPLFVVGELLNLGKSAEEVFRDSLYAGANRQVVVVYDLRGNGRILKSQGK